MTSTGTSSNTNTCTTTSRALHIPQFIRMPATFFDAFGGPGISGTEAAIVRVLAHLEISSPATRLQAHVPYDWQTALPAYSHSDPSRRTPCTRSYAGRRDRQECTDFSNARVCPIFRPRWKPLAPTGGRQAKPTVSAPADSVLFRVFFPCAL
jgi:hypothetical protein